MFSRRSSHTLRILSSTSLLALVATSLSNAAWAADSDRNDTTPPAVTITVVTPAENLDHPQSTPTDQPATTSVDGSAPIATQAAPALAAADILGAPATQEDADEAPANATNPTKEGTGDSLAKPHDSATPADSEAQEATPTSPEVAANLEAAPAEADKAQSTSRTAPQSADTTQPGTTMRAAQGKQAAHEPRIAAAPQADAPPADAPIDWEKSFPDPVLRAAIQKILASIPTPTYADLARVSGLGLRNSGVKSLEGIHLLERLSYLDVSNTAVTSVDLSRNPKVHDITIKGTPICPRVEFTRAGKPQYYDHRLCHTNHSWPSGAYILDGDEHTYSYKYGSGRTSYFSVRPDLRGTRPLSFEASPNGTKNSFLLGQTFKRDEVRLVQSDGTIVHTVTVTNVTDTPQPTEILMSIDTELDGNDIVDLYTTGKGGVVISNDKLSVYLDAISLPSGTMYGGTWSESYNNARSVRDAIIAKSIFDVTNAAGVQLTKSVDSAVYYLFSPRTLAPGESITFSVREALHVATTLFNGRVDYVTLDSNGQPTVLHFVTKEGAKGEVWDFSSYPEMPAGYELDPAHPAPTQMVLGQDGQFTVVPVWVRKATTPPPPPPPTPNPPTPNPPAPQPPAPNPPAPQPTPPPTPAPAPAPKPKPTPKPAPAPKPAPHTPAQPQASQPPTGLAKTGADSALLVLAAGLSVLGGVALTRRRK